MSNLPQAGSVMQYGGKYDSALNGLILPSGVAPVILYSGRTTPTVNQRQSFTKAGTATQVKASVTAAKTLIVPGFYYNSNSPTAIAILFGYNTSTFTDDSAVGAGDIYYGNGATSAFGVLTPALVAAGQPVWLPYPMVFPAGAFPFWIPSANSQYSVIMIGYEV